MSRQSWIDRPLVQHHFGSWRLSEALATSNETLTNVGFMALHPTDIEPQLAS